MMGILQEPDDSVVKMISIPRWQREWINSRRSINFSGLAQEIIIELMKNYDPDYYFEHEHLVSSRGVNKRDMIMSVLKNHPEIVPAI